MKTKSRKIISLILVLIITVSIVPIGIMPVHAGLTISQIQAKFPDGKYWNHVGGPNNPDGWTNTPCTHHDNCDYYGGCDCNSFSNAIQCMGYAFKVAYDYYGSCPRDWGTSYDVNSLKPGDYVRLTNHSIWITDIAGDTVYYTEANVGGTCLIKWGSSKTKQNIADSLDHIKVAPYTATGGTVSVLTNNQYAKIGENITFRFDAAGATNLVLYIYLNGIKQFEGMFYPGDTYTTNFSNAGHYNYGIIVNYNGKYVESVWHTFVVVNPTVLTNKETYVIGEKATFSFDVAESTNLILYIYLDGIKQYEGMFVSGETYIRPLSENGRYSFGIVVNYNGKNIESTWHSFVVNPVPPGKPNGLNSPGKTDTTVTLSWNTATTATGYNVYKGATKVNSTPITATSFTVTGLTQNTAYSFTVKAVNAGGESAASAPLSVTTLPIAIPVTKITLSTTSLKWTVGKSGTLSATITPSNVTNKTVSWKSSNTAVATVDSAGKVTAIGAGTATITCTAKDGSGVKAICNITVYQPVTSIKLNAASLKWAVGKTGTLTATISPSTATNKTVTWKSSNTAVATIDSTGKVTAKGVGTATITCTAKDGSGIKATCKITVIPKTPTNLKAVKATTTSIKLTWSAVSGATGYYVYRSTSKTGTYTKIKTLTGTTYTNTGLTKGKTYYYKVQAYKAVGSTLYTSSSSNIVYAKL